MLHQAGSQSPPASVHDLPDENLKQILLSCRDRFRYRGERSITEVCTKWRYLADSFENPVHILAREGDQYHLRTPKDAVSAEGCRSWCRRNGHKLAAAMLELTSSWWLSPGSPLSSLVNLQKLDLYALRPSDVLDVTSVEPLAQLTGLKQLSLFRLVNVSSLEPLTQLSRLEVLKLENCSAVEDLSPVNQLSKLTALTVLSCDVEDLQGLALPSLQDLEFEAQSLPGVSVLSGLTSLVFHKTEMGGSLPQFKRLLGLKELTLYNVDTWVVGKLRSGSLTRLVVANGEGEFGYQTGCRGMPNLRELDVDSSFLGDISPVTNLRQLEKLAIRDDLMEWDTLGALDALTGLKRLELPDVPDEYVGDEEVIAAMERLEAKGVKIIQ